MASKNEHDVIIYGRDGCGMCARFQAHCKEEGIEYRMVNCDDEKGGQEMWTKVRSSEWFESSGGSVGLPVVDAFGHVLMQPSIDEVMHAKHNPKEMKKAMSEKGHTSKSAIEETLKVHNALRAKHGCGPLTWSEECYDMAKKQAKHCQDIGGMAHGNLHGISGAHGQNIYWHSNMATPADATEAWYEEIHDPGYDFSKPGFTTGVGHFTQVVWKDTKEVGLAISEDGCFIVANYYPAGNNTGPGQFAEHVPPPTHWPSGKAPPPKKAASGAAKSVAEEVVIYGRDGCGMCSRFKSQCEDAGVPHRMVSCDDEEGGQEMWAKARDTEWFKASGGSVGLPIVDAFGTCMMRPSLDEIMAAKPSSVVCTPSAKALEKDLEKVNFEKHMSDLKQQKAQGGGGKRAVRTSTNTMTSISGGTKTVTVVTETQYSDGSTSTTTEVTTTSC